MGGWARIIGGMSVRTLIASPARGFGNLGGELFARVVSELSDGIWKRNLKTGELWLSSRFMQALGFEANEYVPEKDLFDERLHSDDRAAMQTSLQKAARVLGQCAYEVRIRTKQDGYRWFRGQARAWPGADGKAAILIGAVFNVHGEKAALDDLQRQHAQLTEMYRDKNLTLRDTLRDVRERQTELEKIRNGRVQFISDMSHDVRASLANMMCMTELALRSTDPDARQRRLEVALGAGHALQAMLDDVFEYAQLESGAVVFKVVGFDLSELTADACRSMNDQLSESDGCVEYDFIGQHLTAVADVTRLQEVVRRFFSHVVKTRPFQSPVRFTTRVTEAASRRLTVRFEIGCSIGLLKDDPDTGTVLAEDSVGDCDEDLWGEGCGLNLFIARRLVEALGGEVSLKRSVDGGTYFLVKLSIAQALHDAGEFPEIAADRTPESIWIIGHPGSDVNLLARRIRRLGFDPLVLESHHALLSCQERLGTPHWSILTESQAGLLMPLPEVRRLLPHTRIMVSARSVDVFEHAMAAGVAVFYAPLSLRILVDRIVQKSGLVGRLV